MTTPRKPIDPSTLVAVEGGHSDSDGSWSHWIKDSDNRFYVDFAEPVMITGQFAGEDDVWCYLSWTDHTRDVGDMFVGAEFIKAKATDVMLFPNTIGNRPTEDSSSMLVVLPTVPPIESGLDSYEPLVGRLFQIVDLEHMGWPVERV